jgi:PhnB protein
MTSINPYLVFNGNCSEVMTFYKECLGADLAMQKVSASPMAEQWPGDVQNQILHATLTINGAALLLGSDMAPEPPIAGSDIVLSLTCDTREELQIAFDKLSQDGQLKQPLHEFFAGTMGTLTDKFGRSWMFYAPKQL